MKNTVFYIEANSELRDSLTLLADKIVGDKKIVFPISEYAFDDILIDNKIIKVEFENYEILDFESVSWAVFSWYEKSFGQSIEVDFAANASLLNRINESFKFDRFVSGLSVIKKSFWQYAIFQSNNKFGCEFTDYLGAISRELNREEIYSFSDAYSTELYELDISFENIYSNALRLLFLLKDENSANDGAVLNLNIANIFNGLRKFSKENYSAALDLFDFAFGLEEKNENIISSLISGLYDAKKENFYELRLKDIIENAEYPHLVFWGLSNIDEVRPFECDLFIDLFDKFSLDVKAIYSALSLLMSIIKSSNEIYFEDSFKRIISALDYESNTSFILNNIYYIDKCENEKTDLIVPLINKEYFEYDKYIKAIGDLFLYIEDVECFSRVIIALIEKEPFKSNAKVFNSYLSTADKYKIDAFLIGLLTNNSAAMRYTGLELFDDLSSYDSYKFTLDILSLPYITQYKLWVALTMDSREPKHCIPSLLKLINSGSGIVKESFICKLEEISEDYGSAITEVLEKNLSEDNEYESSIMLRLKQYIREYFRANTDIKRSIKEFNPFYTSNREVTMYNELFHKKMSSGIKKGSEENSLIKILGVKTVHLAKGGGWKFGNKKEISRLGTISSSFSLPRSYFMNPNEYEITKGLEMREDWKLEDFSNIEDAINNE